MATNPKPATQEPPAVEAPAPPKRIVLKVRATMLGYYGDVRRRVGDVFVLTDQAHYTTRWMEPVDPLMREKITSGPQALKNQHDELLRERYIPAGGTPLANDEDANAVDNPLLA